MRIKLLILSLIALVVIAATPAVVAETITIGAAQVLPKDSSTLYTSNGGNLFWLGNPGEGYFLAPIVFPQGAVIRKVTLEARDNSGGEFGGYVRADLAEFEYNTFLKLIDSVDLDTGLEEAPGDTRVSQTLFHTVDNSRYHYGFGITINNPEPDLTVLAFYKLIVEYDVTQLEVVEPASGFKLLKVD